MVTIESLACRTSPIATPWGSVAELTDDGVSGFVRCSDADLVEDLGHLDTLDRAACRRVARSRFSTERMARDHLALYEQVLDGRVRGQHVQLLISEQIA